MDIPKPTPPKPAPPKFVPPPVHPVEEVTKVNYVSAYPEEIINGTADIPEGTFTPVKDLPPINFKSPDGKRVVEVRDPVKAKSMTSKGWTVTIDKKTPFVPAEHLTEKPLRDNPELLKLKQSMDTHPPLTHRQKSAIRHSTKNTKENN